MLVPPVLHTTAGAPVLVERRGDVLFADFGLDWFGNLQVTVPADAATTVMTIRFGEKLQADGTIDRQPVGSVSFVQTTLTIEGGQTVGQPTIPLTPGPQSAAEAITLPAAIGNITPFRYVEIEGASDGTGIADLAQIAVHTAFDSDASSFTSSDETLDAVWELCKHTMTATTAFGVFVDGDRERLPYEADAYLNMLSYFAVDLNPEVSAYTFEYLLDHPTWPVEWSLHMPMIAAQLYRATGDPALAARSYDALVAKLLMDRARDSDGLLHTSAIVDWPPVERDGYHEGGVDPDEKRQVGPMINTVANAFYFHALREMAYLAAELDRADDAAELTAQAEQIHRAFNAVFFDADRGVYVDGEGSTHASLHANMFALAFDLVPDDRMPKVAEFVRSRGMATSVYGAQYLLEALYRSGMPEDALRLMTSHDRRSWFNMIRGGSTLTWEAWDPEFKPNLTWNHAWGAVPANIIARFLVGVTPLTAGYETIAVAPRPGTLTWFTATVPTARGPVSVGFRSPGSWEIEVPPDGRARVSLPGFPGIAAHQVEVGPGRHVFASNRLTPPEQDDRQPGV